MTAPARKQPRLAVLRLVTAIADPGEHWKQRAACKNHPRPDTFYPPPPARAGWRKRTNASPARSSRAAKHRAIIIAEAKKLCETCPVITECATYAIARNDKYGIWGGLTPAQRGHKREDR